MVPQRAWLLTAQSKVRKSPKPRRPVSTEQAKATAKLQTKYITLYTTQYRKDLIDEPTFLSNLLQLGIMPELAEVTVAIEQAKKGVVSPAG